MERQLFPDFKTYQKNVFSKKIIMSNDSKGITFNSTDLSLPEH